MSQKMADEPDNYDDWAASLDNVVTPFPSPKRPPEPPETPTIRVVAGFLDQTATAGEAASPLEVDFGETFEVAAGFVDRLGLKEVLFGLVHFALETEEGAAAEEGGGVLRISGGFCVALESTGHVVGFFVDSTEIEPDLRLGCSGGLIEQGFVAGDGGGEIADYGCLYSRDGEAGGR